MVETSPEEVLRFWFGPPDAPPDARSSLWWGGTDEAEEFDREIEERFGEVVSAALEGDIEDWRGEPRSCLAYVLVLDQFTRNIYRGGPEAFAGDDRAISAARLACERDYHAELTVPEQLFLTMPMMHSEEREVQRQAVEKFERIRDGAPESTRGMAEGSLEHAREHCDLIEEFGRFPHRNPVLGREMTDEEREYLEKTGNWYGQKPDGD